MGEEKQIATRPSAIIEAKFDLEAKQNDIIDMLLVELKNDDKVEYELNIEKYKKYYKGDTSNIYRDLKRAVKGFEKKGVTIKNDIDGTEDWYAWFSKITYKNREGKIRVRLDSEFKTILTEVKRRISYDIENTLKCASKYSKRLYYHLKLYEDTGWRIDNLDDLRQKLKSPASHKSFGKFKEKVLEVAKKEINSLTDIDFDYEEIKSGRKTERIKFTIKGNKAREIYKEISIDTEEKEEKVIYPELSVETVYELLKDKITLQDAKKIPKALDTGFKKQNKCPDKMGYLEDKIEYLKSYSKTYEEGSSYIALLLTALKNDWNSADVDKKTTLRDDKAKQLRFNDFEQREYDYDSLEKKLLGWDKED